MINAKDSKWILAEVGGLDRSVVCNRVGYDAVPPDRPSAYRKSAPVTPNVVEGRGLDGAPRPSGKDRVVVGEQVSLGPDDRRFAVAVRVERITDHPGHVLPLIGIHGLLKLGKKCLGLVAIGQS